MSRRYHEYHDDLWVTIDPRIHHTVGHVQLRMETEDVDYDDDDYHNAYINVSDRDELTRIIEALTFARDAVFLPPADVVAQPGLPGVPSPIDAARDEMVRSIDRDRQWLQEQLRTWQGPRKDAADALYQATLTAIHETSDPAVREALQSAVLEYDFVMRFGRDAE